MKILDQYIRAAVLRSFFMVLLVILALDVVFSFVDELEQTAGDYQLWQIFEFIFSRLPRRAYEYLSLTLLIGCLIGLGSLAGNSELVILRSVGISAQRILWAVLKPVILISLLGLALAEYVVPNLESLAQSRKAVAQGADRVVRSKLNRGYWHREGETFMRFAAIEPRGVLHGVSLYEFDEQKNLVRQTNAERAIYSKQEGWTLQHLLITELSGEQFQQEKLVALDWQTELSPEALSVVMVAPRDMAISSLRQYADYLQQQGLDAGRYYLAFWNKLLQPLGIIALVLLGSGFIFGPLRSVSMGYRVFSGILLGLVYRYAIELLGPASLVFGFPALLATVVPILVCAGLGWYFLRNNS